MTEKCSNCNGTGQTCGHGSPANECPAPEDRQCTYHNEVMDCTNCTGHGYVIADITWKIEIKLLGSDELKELLNDGWEPFQVIPTGSKQVILKKAFIKE